MCLHIHEDQITCLLGHNSAGCVGVGVCERASVCVCGVLCEEVSFNCPVLFVFLSWVLISQFGGSRELRVVRRVMMGAEMDRKWAVTSIWSRDSNAA